MDVRVGPERKLSAEESMLLNCDVGMNEESVNLIEASKVKHEGGGNKNDSNIA